MMHERSWGHSNESAAVLTAFSPRSTQGTRRTDFTGVQAGRGQTAVLPRRAQRARKRLLETCSLSAFPASCVRSPAELRSGFVVNTRNENVALPGGMPLNPALSHTGNENMALSGGMSHYPALSHTRHPASKSASVPSVPSVVETFVALHRSQPSDPASVCPVCSVVKTQFAVAR
jgi:hypothetical protein